jgi:hypothetical protein
MYPEGANPLFAAWTADLGGGGPYLWENDSHILDAGWLEENIEFLTTTLTTAYVRDKVASAVARLRAEPEREMAQRLEHDLATSQDLIALRVAELPILLSRPQSVDGWSI